MARDIARRARPLLACLLLAGCSAIPYEPVDQPVPAAAEPPAPAQVEPPPVAPPPPPAASNDASRPESEPPSIAILVSDSIPAYNGIAAALSEVAGERRIAVFDLDGDPARIGAVMEKVRKSGSDQLVAIGLLAARAGHEYSESPIVFCQVFNHQDDNLLASGSRGVALVPPFSMQLEAWQTLSPQLRRIGVITGPGHEELIREATVAARTAGIELVSRVVKSDKETLYVFKRLVPEIEGLWLLPDNRILSPNVLRELMQYSRKHNQQIVAFNPALLEWGAVMSVTATDTDVARQVLGLIDEPAPRGDAKTGTLTPLTEMHVEINEALARRLGLDVPGQAAQRITARAD